VKIKDIKIGAIIEADGASYKLDHIYDDVYYKTYNWYLTNFEQKTQMVKKFWFRDIDHELSELTSRKFKFITSNEKYLLLK
jgi:hypothetical protein